MRYSGKTGEFFELEDSCKNHVASISKTQKDQLRLFWFCEDNNRMEIDGIPHVFHKNDIVFLTEFHKVSSQNISRLRCLSFNKPFYCILNHDSEVSCKGVLFYGAANLPVIKLKDKELEVFETAWKMAVLEFEMHDNLQIEMLQMMLKRILILCTRVYKKQHDLEALDQSQNNLVRDFNYLVESHFTSKHAVADYADLLHKSPKTISNTFKKLGEKTPLQFIQDRLILEARRLLFYSDKDVSEIAFDLGFNDLQSFSRFFKNQENQSPSDFRESRDSKPKI